MKNAIKNITKNLINYLSSEFTSQEKPDSNAAEILPTCFMPKTKRAAFLANAVLLMLLSLFLTAGTARADSYTVNMNTDAGDKNMGDNVCDSDLATPGEQCTLRAAVEEADFSSNLDFIGFSLPQPSSIVLTLGELVVSSSMNIDGPGARGLTIERGGVNASNFRIFAISGGSTSVNISGVTITNGLCDSFCNTIFFISKEKGGGIYFSGANLNLTGVTVRNNLAEEGGGIYIDRGTANITRSTVSSNIAKRNGGGIYNYATANISNTTVSGNNTTSIDPTYGGGGIFNTIGSATLTNVTVSNNTTPNQGGGIKNENMGTVNLRNTIVAQNSASPSAVTDVNGTFVSLGNNLIGISAGGNGFTNGANGDKVGTTAAPLDAKLGALQSNGGQTDTRALSAGSPAIDSGNNCVVTVACPGANPPQALTTDQRGAGFDRKLDGDGNGTATVDIGAFEAITIVTAAEVVAGGRILTANGKGIRNVKVIVTFPSGETRTTVSGAGGFYQFPNVPAGDTCIFSVLAKHYVFSQPTQIRNINDDTPDIDFTAVQNSLKKEF